MPGSTFGRCFTVTTFGESHGPAIGCIVEGVPPQIALDESDIQQDLDRRRPGQSSVTTPRKEADQVEILSGVFEGKTTGAPVALLIRNTNQKSKDYSQIKDLFRPGHADYTFEKKYGFRDYRGGGRSSGRETACRVAAGAIAKRVLANQGVSIMGYTKSIYTITAESMDYHEIENNPVRCPDAIKAQEMVALIEQLKKEGDSVGGVVEVVITGCPAGLGEPVFDKLDACLAHGFMSVGTVKGVEIGSGFASTRMKGSEHNDAFEMQDGDQVGTSTNYSGGILGGISSGEEIIVRAAIKPASSIRKTQDTVSKTGDSEKITVEGRHDPCICPRAVPVLEAMAALVILDLDLIQKSISN